MGDLPLIVLLLWKPYKGDNPRIKVCPKNVQTMVKTMIPRCEIGQSKPNAINRIEEERCPSKRNLKQSTTTVRKIFFSSKLKQLPSHQNNSNPLLQIFQTKVTFNFLRSVHNTISNKKITKKPSKKNTSKLKNFHPMVLFGQENTIKTT